MSLCRRLSNQTRSTTWRILMSCKYSSYFIPFYLLMYYFSSLRTTFHNKIKHVFLHSNESLKYSVTGKDWWHSLIEALWFGFMVFSVTFNNISVITWRSVLLVEETGGPGENHRLVASHRQTLSHNVVHFSPIGIRTHSKSDL